MDMTVAILVALGISVYWAIKNHRYSKRLERLLINKEVELSNAASIVEQINDLSSKMLKIEDQDALMHLILEKTVHVINNAELGSVMFLEADGRCTFVACIGFDLKKLQKVVFHVSETFLYDKTEGRLDRGEIITNVLAYNDTRDLSKKRNIKLKEASVNDIVTTMSLPIVVNDQVYGLINLDSTVPNAFTKEDLAFAEVFVGKASMAIKNHLLLKETIQLSRYDTLTNIYNRRYFEELLEHSIEHGVRFGERFLVVIFDLNGLKKINDSYGHMAGDGLIAFFTDHVGASIRGTDVFARYGGDEFAGIFYEVSQVELKEKLEAMTEWFDGHLYHYESDAIKCSFSYGIAEFGVDSRRYDELIRIADDRMYQYKRGLRFQGK